MSFIEKKPATLSSVFSDWFSDEDFFGPNWTNWPFKGRMANVPAANVKENGKCFVVELGVPGMEKKDFDIAVENGYLTISSEKEEENVEKDEKFTRKEYSYNSFRRSFRLPENVNEEQISAGYVEGVLRIELPKKEPANVLPPKKVEIS